MAGFRASLQHPHHERDDDHSTENRVETMVQGQPDPPGGRLRNPLKQDPGDGHEQHQSPQPSAGGCTENTGQDYEHKKDAQDLTRVGVPVKRVDDKSVEYQRDQKSGQAGIGGPEPGRVSNQAVIEVMDQAHEIRIQKSALARRSLSIRAQLITGNPAWGLISPCRPAIQQQGAGLGFRLAISPRKAPFSHTPRQEAPQGRWARALQPSPPSRPPWTCRG